MRGMSICCIFSSFFSFSNYISRNNIKVFLLFSHSECRLQPELLLMLPLFLLFFHLERSNKII